MMQMQPFKVQLIHCKNWLFKVRFANAWFGRPELFLQASTVERIMKIKMPSPVCFCIWFWRNLFWIFCAADWCVVQMPHKVCAVTVRLAACWNRSLDYRHARFTLESRINEMAWSESDSVSGIYNNIFRGVSEILSCLYNSSCYVCISLAVTLHVKSWHSWPLK